MGHSLQIPFSVLSILLFFFFFSPCRILSWWQQTATIFLPTNYMEQFIYIILSKAHKNSSQKISLPPFVKGRNWRNWGRWNNLPKVQKHSESRLDFRSLWIYMPLLQIVYTVWLSHKQKSTSESKVEYIRNSVIWCCYSGCCLRTVPPSLSPGELAEHLN